MARWFRPAQIESAFTLVYRVELDILPTSGLVSSKVLFCLEESHGQISTGNL